MKILTLLLLLPFTSQAAIFDAPDILPANSGAVGVFGEMLLNDPTSEGAEVRGRYGFSDEWNFGVNLGTGSRGKQFRFGGETVFNIIPDWEGQVGLSALASLTILERLGSTGVQTRLGLMAHKKFDSFTGHPATGYLAIPFYLEGRKGTYTTGGQFVVGSLWDINSQSRFFASTELGIKIGNAESYALLGMGFRLGELRFQKRSRSGGDKSQSTGEPEYQDDDFR
jgi:hypothetical protein